MAGGRWQVRRGRDRGGAVSWDAELYVMEGHRPVVLREWNYTHNTSRMIDRVRGFAFPGSLDDPWWRVLDGMSGEEGAVYLDTIIGGLMEAPALFRSMNPPNGWGDYDSLLGVLNEMRELSCAQPTARWGACG